MKRKSVTVVLSLALCAAMVAETGTTAVVQASDLLTSGEIETPEAPTEEAPAETPAAVTPSEEVQIPQEAEEPSGDALLLPETQTTDNTPMTDNLDEITSGGENTESVGEAPAAETPETVTQEEVEIDETDFVGADGSFVVHADSWIKVEAGFKLLKPTETKAETASQVGEAETAAPVTTEVEVPISESQEEVFPEALEAALTGESEQAAETPAAEPEAPAAVETMQVGETEKTYVTAADGIVKVTTETVKGSHTGYYLFDADGILVTTRKEIAAGTPGYNGTEPAEMYFADNSDAKLYPEYSSDIAKTPITSTVGQRQADFWHYADGRFAYFDKDGLLVPIKERLTQLGNPSIVEINGEFYSLKSDGTPKVGLTYLSGKAYWFNEKSTIPGAMRMNIWGKFKTKNGYKWLYFRPESAGAEKGRAQEHTGYFTANLGTSRTYLLNRLGYVQKSKIAKAENGKKYGCDHGGRIYRNKLVKIGKYRYYFTGDGSLATFTNRWIRLNGNTGGRYYYFGSSAGRIVEKKGFQKVTNGKGEFLGWFYFPSTGNHYKDRFMGRKYFNNTGRMASGRTTVRGKQYIFEISDSQNCRGDMYRGTMLRYNNRWFYAQSNGQLFKEGWIQIQGNWYFFYVYSPKVNTFEWHGSTYGHLDGSGIFRTGWITVNDAQNLVKYVNPQGNGFYKNTSAVINGLRYYFDANGYRINDLTHIYKSGYYVEVDRVNGVATVYDSSRTVPVKSIRVSVGARGTETPLGTYHLSAAGRWQMLMGPSVGQYGTHVDGAGRGGIFFHSIPMSSASHYGVPALPYSILGQPASHGCIRCCVADAKFIYEKCNGSTVRIFDGTYTASEAFKGPLGRRALVPMTGNFDPTDPAI